MSLALAEAPVLAAVEAPVLPDFDRPDADELADEILLSSAATTKVAKVTAGTSRSRFSGQVANIARTGQTRAWTRGGRVD
jgi:hypothetical protein